MPSSGPFHLVFGRVGFEPRSVGFTVCFTLFQVQMHQFQFRKTRRTHSQPKETKVQFHQCVYGQLLLMQIPKAVKAALVDCLFVLLGSACVKAACKHIDEIDPKT